MANTQKKSEGSPSTLFSEDASKPVSRVLSFKTAIYLDAPLPVRSSRLPGTVGPTCVSLHGVAPDRVYSDGQFPAVGCALTAPFHPYRQSKALTAVSLCCTFPEVAFGGRYPLSLPCGARTFLMNRLSPCPRNCLAYSQGLLYRMAPEKSTGDRLLRRGAVKIRGRPLVEGHPLQEEI